MTLTTKRNVLRKGQHLFNEIERQYGGDKLREEKLHQILFYMDDIVFNDIMESIK